MPHDFHAVAIKKRTGKKRKKRTKKENGVTVMEGVGPYEPSCGTRSVIPLHSETGETSPPLDCHLCQFTAESETTLWDHMRGHCRVVIIADSESAVGHQTPKLFTASNGEVHLGSGLHMKEAELNRILKSKSDLRAARDTARRVWTRSEMKIRCLPGQPCWRIPDSVAKQAATPEIVDAVMNVVRKVVKDNPTTTPAAKRVAWGRKAVRDLFAYV